MSPSLVTRARKKTFVASKVGKKNSKMMPHKKEAVGVAHTGVLLGFSPNSRAEGEELTYRERIPLASFEQLSKWIKTWIVDMEEIFCSSNKDQERYSDHFYVRIDAVKEAAKTMAKRGLEMVSSLELAKLRVTVVKGKLAAVEERAGRAESAEAEVSAMAARLAIAEDKAKKRKSWNDVCS